MDRVHRNAFKYFLLQGFATVVWWLCLWSYPSSRRFFILGGDESTLLSFWLPDFVVIVAGSLIVAGLSFKRSALVVPAIWATTAGTGYAALYTLAFAVRTDTGWLGVVMMFPAFIISGNFAIGLTPQLGGGMFRRAAPSSAAWLLVKTVSQIVVVWTLILAVVPSFIVAIEAKTQIPRFVFPWQMPVATILFVLISLPGVAAAYTMARLGGGTPLPLDATNRLVVRGIYSYIRNPMAVSGIGQGIVVGIGFGSVLVILYAVVGGLIWQWIFRPLEEEDLGNSFGSDFEDYRRRVKCWIPRFSRFD